MDKYEKAMIYADSIQQKAKEKDLTEIKIGTILTLKVVDKISKGQSISDFSDDDWKEIANAVAKYAILTEDSVYSA